MVTVVRKTKNRILSKKSYIDMYIYVKHIDTDNSMVIARRHGVGEVEGSKVKINGDSKRFYFG